MNVEKFIRLIQVTSVLIILAGAVIGFVSEINLMIAITAISRLIILQKKDLDPSILIYESVAILIIAVAIIVLRLRYLTFLKPKRNYK